MFTDAHTAMLQKDLADRPDLWDKLTPKYNLGCKRIIISDDYFPALARDNVALETRPIDSIQGSQIKVKTDNGEVVDTVEGGYDLLVCATGFQTTQFLHPIELTGLKGRKLSEIWQHGAKALYGMTVEEIPNFAMLYGPNTNLGHNSIILMIEAQSRYINGLIKPVLEARRNGKNVILTPRKSVLEEHNRVLQAKLQASAFNDPNCNSWYKNDAGLITNNWCGTVVQYQQIVETVKYAEDFEVEGSGKEFVERQNKLHVGRVREETNVTDMAVFAAGVLGTVALVGGFVLRNSRYLQNMGVR